MDNVMMMMMMTLWLQTQAALLRSVMSGGVETRVVAVGIGDGVDQSELLSIASPPTDMTVILVQDFTSLPTVQQQLRDQTCEGKHVPFAVVLNCWYNAFASFSFPFYSASAQLLAMQSAVLAMTDSVCLSVRLSVTVRYHLKMTQATIIMVFTRE